MKGSFRGVEFTVAGLESRDRRERAKMLKESFQDEAFQQFGEKAEI